MPRVFSFHYKLTDGTGNAIDSSAGGEPFTFIEGTRQVIPGLEKQMINLKAGDKKNIQVPASEGYGERKENLVFKVPPDRFPQADVKIGDRFKGGPEPDAPVFTVVEVTEADILLDGNHPLAGLDLIFDIEVTDIREATQEELQHGHVHGAGGHSH